MNNRQFDIPDEIHNWVVSYLTSHSDCTIYLGEVLTAAEMATSIIQGSGIGPASYILNAVDLNAVTPGNQLLKFADDTYVIIPAVSAGSPQAELKNIEEWSRTNNLKPNPNLSQVYAEIVFVNKRRKVIKSGLRRRCQK